MYEVKNSTGTVFVQLQHVLKVLQQSKQVGHTWFFLSKCDFFMQETFKRPLRHQGIWIA